MIKRVSAILFLIAIMPALFGVHVVHHVCHLNNHHSHVDLELLAGVSSSTYCSSPENHCCADDEDNASHDCTGCNSEYVILDAVRQSLIHKVEFNLQPLELVVFSFAVLSDPSSVDETIIPPVCDAESSIDADWQSFSGIYRC